MAADRDPRETGLVADDRCREDRDGEPVAGELDERAGVVDLVGDRAPHACEPERAVVHDPRAPERRELGEALVREVGQLDALPRRQRMVDTAEQVHRELAEARELDTRMLLLQRDEPEVELAAGDLPGELSGAAAVGDEHVDARVLAGERRDELGRVGRGRPHRLHDAELHGPAEPGRRIGDGVARRLRGRQRRAGLGEQGPAGVGGARSASRALEELGTQLLLEPADRGRHGGLHDVQTVGRAREALRFGDGDEHLELTQVHAPEGIADRDSGKHEVALPLMAARRTLLP
ncbi:MAG: hypothetical protein PGN13_10010 [Patulibacter minatonensis]